MSEEQEEKLTKLANEYLGTGADDYLELLARFDAAHPRDEPHYYLSLLGTHPDHRGKGIGMALLEHDLALIDTDGFPAYLESSNPANNHRYAGVGFEELGESPTLAETRWSRRCGDPPDECNHSDACGTRWSAIVTPPRIAGLGFWVKHWQKQ